MGFFKKKDKVFTVSESFNLLERTDVDIQIEENIKTAGIHKFASSEYADLYLRVNELGGFLILETILVSATNLKSKKGSTLSFKNENELLKLASDENKIESDFSKAVNKAVTKIDYNISTEEAENFKEEKYTEVRFEINGNEILFSVLTP
jgi:alpha-glucosidase (family GH31 glycosyl hydrolase)